MAIFCLDPGRGEPLDRTRHEVDLGFPIWSACASCSLYARRLGLTWGRQRASRYPGPGVSRRQDTGKSGITKQTQNMSAYRDARHRQRFHIPHSNSLTGKREREREGEEGEMIDVRFSAMWGRVASLSSISFRNIFWKSLCIVLPRCVNACDDCIRPHPCPQHSATTDRQGMREALTFIEFSSMCRTRSKYSGSFLNRSTSSGRSVTVVPSWASMSVL